jgi:hypothetical protein
MAKAVGEGAPYRQTTVLPPPSRLLGAVRASTALR